MVFACGSPRPSDQKHREHTRLLTRMETLNSNVSTANQNRWHSDLEREREGGGGGERPILTSRPTFSKHEDPLLT